MTRLFHLIAALVLWAGIAAPAQAAVTVTFWSHELGNSFPHAFVTLRGVPDAGGAPVDANFGFTAKSVTPALLFGPVAGKLDIARPTYIGSSDAQFSVVMSDAQYAAVLTLAAAWDEKGGDNIYRLNDRNCVHFVKEIARIVGLTGLDQPKLMKKPRSYLKAVSAANVGRIMVIDRHGKDYLAGLARMESVAVPGQIVTTTTPPPVPAPN